MTSYHTTADKFSCGAHSDAKSSGDVDAGTRQARSESSDSVAACGRLEYKLKRGVRSAPQEAYRSTLEPNCVRNG